MHNKEGTTPAVQHYSGIISDTFRDNRHRPSHSLICWLERNYKWSRNPIWASIITILIAASWPFGIYGAPVVKVHKDDNHPPQK